MENICSEVQCTGCCLCFAVCPKNAIIMTENVIGVVVPKINKELCINCGLCQKKCPQNIQNDMADPKFVYAVWAKDKKEQLSSSSGGAASVFYKQFIKHYSGLCVGSSFQEGLFLAHKIVKTHEETIPFKGSKYVQSFMGNIFTQIEGYVKKSVPILFIGTPCQVDGIKTFLGKDTEYLFTVDLICHGTPPISYLQEHFRKYLIKNPELIVNFRTNNQFRISLSSSTGFKKILRNDIYLYAFLKCLTYRESCYHCKYAQKNRVGDITIGDFWGISQDIASLEDAQNGCSAVLINTEKGKRLFDICRNEFIYFNKNIEEVSKENMQLNHPSISHKARNLFLNEYVKHGFNHACNKSLFLYFHIRNIAVIIRSLIYTIFNKR
jgi:coenzyme F420-reducing hydrogenase beta subunit